MAAKFIRLTHKIVIQLHLVAESCSTEVLSPDGQSGNFWIHPRKAPGAQYIIHKSLQLNVMWARWI